MPERKSLARVQIKDEATGQVEAVFSTLNVVDKDGDVTLPGAFTDGAPVVISAYGHGSWSGQLPVGKGTIREDGDQAVLEGQFFLDTTHGRDTFLTVKALSEGDGLQEWSYSLEDVKSHRGQHDGRQVRFIDAVRVKEVSPVLVGAGVDTRTLATKAAKRLNSEFCRELAQAGRDRFGEDSWIEDYDPDEKWAIFEVWDGGEAGLWKIPYDNTSDGLTLADDAEQVQRTTTYTAGKSKFSDEAKSVLADVDRLITRATEVVALRASKGKSIAEGSADLLEALADDLGRLKELLEGDGTPPTITDDAGEALAAEFLRFVASQQGATQP